MNSFDFQGIMMSVVNGYMASVIAVVAIVVAWMYMKHDAGKDRIRKGAMPTDWNL
jgi:hypothetical protein